MSKLTYGKAIREAIYLSMLRNKNVILLGQGIDDPKGLGGTVLGLLDEFGKDRVIDLPLSENGSMGIAIGLAMSNMYPIIVHQHMTFTMLAMDQIVNHAAKWNYMFGGELSIPLVIICNIGQGWGLGSQHGQAMQPYFVHTPGIKVVAPSNPHDAKGLMISSIQDPNPVIYIQHFKCFNSKSHVPKKYYTTKISKGKIIIEGGDITLVSYSSLIDEAISAANELLSMNISCEVIDLRTISPIDYNLIVRSVSKTRRLVIVDPSTPVCSVSAEIISVVQDKLFDKLKSRILRINYPDCHIPASPALVKFYYPSQKDIVDVVKSLLKK